MKLTLLVIVGLISISQCFEEDFEVEFEYPLKVSRHGTPGDLQKNLGVPDVVAISGKLFEYKIPENAFKSSKPYNLKFVNMPTWIQAKDMVLQGVPLDADIGHHYIKVVATSDRNQAKDMFEINVVSAAENPSQDASCRSADGISLMTVVLGSPLDKMTAKRRVNLVKKFARLTKLDTTKVTITRSPSSFDPLSDGSSIMTGPGSSKHSHGDTQIQVQMGCGGRVHKKKLFDLLKKTAKNGKLQSSLRVPIVGWHLSIADTTTHRFRRDTFDDFSGDYYNYDDEYEDYDQFFNEIGGSNGGYEVTESPTDTPDTVQPQYVSPVPKPTPHSTHSIVEPTRIVTSITTNAPTDPTPTEIESSMRVYPSATVEQTVPITTSSSRPHPTEPTMVIHPTPVPTHGETTMYGMKNFAPVIKNRIPKLGWVTGNVYRMKIPPDAFEDPEDGGTRNLSLVLKDSDGKVLAYDSWIQLNAANQELYALPLEKEISRFDLQLEAIDSGHKSTVDKLNIRVTQPREARNYNHEFSITLNLETKFKFHTNVALDWQVRAVDKIAELYNSDITSINVRNISMGSTIHLSWTNVTLVDSASTICPEDDLRQLEHILIEKGSRPTPHAQEIFAPEFNLRHAKVHYYKSCSHMNHDHSTMTEVNRGTFENQPPVYRNQIDQLNPEEGKIFRFKVKEDSCYDLEEGGVSGLNMRLLTTDLSPPPEDHWLQFDENNREFYGLPLKKDVGKRHYLLECKDSLGKKVDDALVVIVSPAEETQPPVQFKIKIDTDYDYFIANVDQKVSVVSKIAKAFSSTPNDVRVIGFEKGSVSVSWTNSSLPSSPCPKEEIEHLRSVMTDDSGNLQESFKAAFLPTFIVTHAEITPMGHCLAGDTPTHAAMPDVGEPPNTAEEQEVTQQDEDYLLTFIIPAVLIALMLILAGLVAYCLWRKRRYAKLSLTDERTFVSKGVPVIFAEELDDQYSDGANVPVIMKEEKPPLPPPEYQRHSPGISTPPRGDPDHGPYQPPHPPYASTNGNRNPRPNMPPAYRKPPTYVPP